MAGLLAAVVLAEVAMRAEVAVKGSSAVMLVESPEVEVAVEATGRVALGVMMVVLAKAVVEVEVEMAVEGAVGQTEEMAVGMRDTVTMEELAAAVAATVVAAEMEAVMMVAVMVAMEEELVEELVEAKAVEGMVVEMVEEMDTAPKGCSRQPSGSCARTRCSNPPRNESPLAMSLDRSPQPIYSAGAPSK